MITGVVSALLTAAGLIVLLANLVGVELPAGATSVATTAVVIGGLSWMLRWGGLSVLGGTRVSQAARDSDGWREATFVMNGLEEDGEALQEYTDEAGMYGYRREPGDVKYSWRFIRDPR